MEPIAAGLHIANIILISLLLYIYSQNYRKIKSKYTIGLMLFAGIFFVQSAVGLFLDASMAMYKSVEAENAAMFLEALKLVSFAVLLKISWE